MKNILKDQLISISSGVNNKTTILANASSIIYYGLENLNWAGFYFIDEDYLLLSCFQGKVACTKLSKNKGVCWEAVNLNKSVIVNDVHKFKTHIACDGNTNSEIVIPIRDINKNIIGVLDIDSPILNRFNEEDKIILEDFVSQLEKILINL